MRTKNKTKQIISMLKDAFNLKNDVEFAAFLGIATTTLSSWKSRDSLDYDLIYAKCVGIDANWLLSGDGEMMRKPPGHSVAASPKAEYVSKEKYLMRLENENKRLIADNERKQELINSFMSGDIIIQKK